jgi:hypothetical protein
MPQPSTVQRILARLEKSTREPFTLIDPTRRTYLAMTYEDLLRLTADEFDPELAAALEAYFARRARKTAPGA